MFSGSVDYIDIETAQTAISSAGLPQPLYPNGEVHAVMRTLL